MAAAHFLVGMTRNGPSHGGIAPLASKDGGDCISIDNDSNAGK
jgi:hypothetical protein